MTDLERQQKILVLAGVLPAIADIIEDLNDVLFRQELKRTANMLHQEIRKNDEMILRKTGVKLSDEQVLITRSFTAWIKKNFDVEEAQKVMIEAVKKEDEKRIIELEGSKNLEYWKVNAEEDYMNVPISVLRYISELEKKQE